MVTGLIICALAFFAAAFWPSKERLVSYRSPEAEAYAERLKGDMIAADCQVEWLRKEGRL